MRRWERRTVERLRETGDLAEEIRSSVSRLLDAVDDPPLPAR